MTHLIKFLCFYVCACALSFAATTTHDQLTASDAAIEMIESQQSKAERQTSSEIIIRDQDAAFATSSPIPTPISNTTQNKTDQCCLPDEFCPGMLLFFGSAGISLTTCKGAINYPDYIWEFAALSSVPFLLISGLRALDMWKGLHYGTSKRTWRQCSAELTIRGVHLIGGVVTAYFLFKIGQDFNNRGEALKKTWGPQLDQYKDEPNCMYNCINPHTNTTFSCKDNACQHAYDEYKNGQDLVTGAELWGMVLTAYYIPYLFRGVHAGVKLGYLTDD
ncbi:MAG: hypothetical protein Q8S21_01010 [Candidatus Paracaedibacteraceae bacterium]|nr:hypothetical protein [Candidatus Paracaedibacteraceae bacterium]